MNDEQKRAESLAMMIRMLVSSLRKHSPHAPQPNDLPSRAMALLRSYGLQGSVLREGSSPEGRASEGPSAEGIEPGGEATRPKETRHEESTQASAPPGAEPDWLHLKRFGYAPGGYMGKCHRCGERWDQQDKRATTCRKCAEEMHREDSQRHGKNDQSHAQDAVHDTGGAGEGRGAGAHKHHEHRDGTPATDGIDGHGNRGGAGLHRADQIRAQAVVAQASAPQVVEPAKPDRVEALLQKVAQSDPALKAFLDARCYLKRECKRGPFNRCYRDHCPKGLQP